MRSVRHACTMRRRSRAPATRVGCQLNTAMPPSPRRCDALPHSFQRTAEPNVLLLLPPSVAVGALDGGGAAAAGERKKSPTVSSSSVLTATISREGGGTATATGFELGLGRESFDPSGEEGIYRRGGGVEPDSVRLGTAAATAASEDVGQGGLLGMTS